MITLKLTEKEAQAILSGAETFFETDIKKHKEENRLATFWLILFKHYKSGIKKAGSQYDKQITKGNNE